MSAKGWSADEQKTKPKEFCSEKSDFNLLCKKMFNYIHFLESNRFSHFILYRCSKLRVIFNQKIPSKTKQNSNYENQSFHRAGRKARKKGICSARKLWKKRNGNQIARRQNAAGKSINFEFSKNLFSPPVWKRLCGWTISAAFLCGNINSC